MTRVFLSLLGHVLKIVASYFGVVGRRVYCKLALLLAGNLMKSQVKQNAYSIACLYVCPLLVVVDKGETFLPCHR